MQSPVAGCGPSLYQSEGHIVAGGGDSNPHPWTSVGCVNSRAPHGHTTVLFSELSPLLCSEHGQQEEASGSYPGGVASGLFQSAYHCGAAGTLLLDWLGVSRLLWIPVQLLCSLHRC